MGVMACDRRGCDNVMCDRISHDRQEYICSSCFEELVCLGPSTDLDEFMRTPPKRYNRSAAEAFFNQIYVKIRD